MRRNVLVPALLVLTLFGSLAIAQAQDEDPSYAAPGQQPQAQPAQQRVWTSMQLDNLVAPIALYPDPLLGQILVASTYPLEVVEAGQWLDRNPNLRGQALVDAAKQQPWDPSIQVLVTVPDALRKLNQDIQWTTDLGNAFLSQQADVMNAVQRLRARAQANGHLASTPQQTVSTQSQGGQQVIVIQPAEPQVIYVPTYDPFYIWGPPVYGYYPPLYYPTFGFGFGFGFNIGFCFGGWGGWGFWGWGPSWFGHTVFVNNYFFNHYGYHDGHHDHHGGGYRGRTTWAHDPVHRMHVPYGSPQVAARYGGRSMPPRNSFQAGTASRGAASPNASGSMSHVGRAGVQANHGVPPQSQRYQNPPRERYQTSQQSQSTSRQNQIPSRGQQVQNQPQQNSSIARQYQSAPQAQRVQSDPQQRYQAPPSNSSIARQYQSGPQVQRFQSDQQQRYQAPQQSAAAPQQPREGPRVVPFGNQMQQRYQAPQQYRPAPQMYQAPQVQRFQMQAPQRYQAPQQYRSAPQMSAPRFSSGGSFSRGGGGSYSRGGGGSYSRGGGGSYSRGGGGGGHHR